ncbi:hypothetical protein [Erysipelothrix aquatica]|uniref:hypothetical protein n=1 Tax=Erysipelothrix aquatica TaxID=2683714 RepID=UPI001915C051|nr:hypothetical protein [Erysipelothrix aquatica]
MKALKTWLQNKDNKVHAAGVLVLAIIALGLALWVIKNPRAAKYELVSKTGSPKIIFVEYGEPANEKDYVKYFELKRNGHVTEDLSNYSVNVEAINHELVSFQLTQAQLELAKGNKKENLTFSDEQKKIINEKSNYKIDVFDKETKLAGVVITVLVIDTKAPEIEAVGYLETEVGTPINFSEVIKASDPIDGAIEVSVEGDVNFDLARTTDLKAVAIDKHGNKTESKFKLIVKEKEVAASTAEPESNTSSNTASSNSSTPGRATTHSNPSSSNSSQSGSSSNNVIVPSSPKPSEPVKPVEPTKPAEPSKPSEPEEDIPSGMLLYKDYGNFNACAAVIDEVSDRYIREWQNSICFSDGTLYYRPN